LDNRAVLVDDAGAAYDLESISNGRLGPDLMAAIGNADALHELDATLGDRDPTGRLDSGVLGPPVPRPPKSFAIGLNYSSHVAESQMEAPKVPLVFTKFTNCITGPNDDVELRGEAVDYEAELVVVIGRGGRDIAAADAWDYVAGATAGQDISDRALQFAASPPHFDLGKSRDSYGPIGPVMVSPDLLPSRDALGITCDVNDERRQDGTSADLIFDVSSLIEYISAHATLEPGDIIFTGTPDGVGAASGQFLRAGDVITTTIEGIGTMRNVCR
ncbi:MAG: fumarylacetoacetate hydrolase family protein, partial [Actinomycetota bacterium]